MREKKQTAVVADGKEEEKKDFPMRVKWSVSIDFSHVSIYMYRASAWKDLCKIYASSTLIQALPIASIAARLTNDVEKRESYCHLQKYLMCHIRIPLSEACVDPERSNYNCSRMNAIAFDHHHRRRHEKNSREMLLMSSPITRLKGKFTAHSLKANSSGIVL